MNLSSVLLLAIAQFVPGQLTRCQSPECRARAKRFAQSVRQSTPRPQAATPTSKPAPVGPLKLKPPPPGPPEEHAANSGRVHNLTGEGSNIRLHIKKRNPGLSDDICALYQSLICQESARRHVPASLIAALLSQESSFNPKARSPSGALGMAQLMPQTLADLGVQDPFDPQQSIRACVQLMATYLAKWKDQPEAERLAVASYRLGYGAIVRNGGVPDIPDVNAFIDRVLSLAHSLAANDGQPRTPPRARHTR